MENRINIAELLRNCPKGMELDCTMFENVTFVRVDMGRKQFPIEIAVSGLHSKYLTKEGCFHDTTLLPEAKCVIYPKGKTTWEGFVPPCKFKDGDIVYFITENDNEYITIFKNAENVYLETYIDVAIATSRYSLDVSFYIDNIKEQRLATAEEKQKLFQAIKENGYKWNPETKTLEKLVVNDSKFKVGAKVLNKNGGIFEVIEILGSKNRYLCASCGAGIGVHHVYDEEELQSYEPMKPKFKVGDRIKQIGSPRCYIIQSIEFDRYILHNNQFIRFGDEHIYELAPNKFDITTLKPFDKVLVRCGSLDRWRMQFFEKYDETDKYPFLCMWHNKYYQCVPYKGNEHLLGTTDDCDEFYKTWK